MRHPPGSSSVLACHDRLRRVPAVRAAALAAFAVLTPAVLAAQAPAAGTLEEREPVGNFERLTVVGSREGSRLAAGAANYVSPTELERFLYTDVNRVLRQVPGVYLVEEEGFGLRPNIGIRGSGIDRNSRITVMEDGVLIAPAPYAAPAAYYFPTMQRIHAVEIRKGSASVRSGPRTTGGALNLMSTPIPDAPLGGVVNLTMGEDDTLLGHAHVGGRNERWGYLLEGIRQETDGFKRIDGGGDAGYDLDDYVGKLRYNTDTEAFVYQELELKLARTEQDSNETYMGLTDADFADRPERRYAASRLDNIETEHEQAELRHYVSFGETFDVTTVLYWADFARNWFKAEQVNGSSLSRVLADPVTFAAEYAWLTGATSPDDAIVLRNNNREYESQGVQTIVGWSPLPGGEVSHAFELGLRYHEDEEDRLQDNDLFRMQNGTLVLTTDGPRGSQDNRLGEAEAFSVYLQDEIRFGSWIVTPGVRHERVELEQTRWAATDPGRDGGATQRASDTVSEVIPGVGAVYLLDEQWTLLANVHRGFNPPSPGSSSDPEESVNYEAGVRYGSDALSAELIGFYNDYENLVGTCTASTGGGCQIGDQFDGGEVEMQGVEASLGWQRPLFAGVTVPLSIAYTYTQAEFQNDFVSDFDEWGTVSAGDELPYLPEHQLHLLTGLTAERWSVSLGATYTGEMRVRAGHGGTGSADVTENHWVVDLAGTFALNDNLRLFARLENLLDDVYVAARRPAGARPGRPQTALIGVSASF